MASEFSERVLRQRCFGDLGLDDTGHLLFFLLLFFLLREAGDDESLLLSRAWFTMRLGLGLEKVDSAASLS